MLAPLSLGEHTGNCKPPAQKSIEDISIGIGKLEAENVLLNEHIIGGKGVLVGNRNDLGQMKQVSGISGTRGGGMSG